LVTPIAPGTPVAVGAPPASAERVEQLFLPTLDLPRTRFAAALPAERAMAARVAAGDRVGCWVLSNPGDLSWHTGRTFHFSTELEATDWQEDIIGRLRPGEKIPTLLVEQAPNPCFTLACVTCRDPLGDGPACVTCGDPLGDESKAVRPVHHPTLTGLEDDAWAQGWRTDGRAWVCPGCPVPERTGW
jgi:hypothetical protein